MLVYYENNTHFTFAQLFFSCLADEDAVPTHHHHSEFWESPLMVEKHLHQKVELEAFLGNQFFATYHQGLQHLMKKIYHLVI